MPSLIQSRQLISIIAQGESQIEDWFEGRSTARGKHPHWLIAASDILLVDLSGEDNTILRFEAPTFGDAAPELYEQKELFDLGKPAPEDTGFDALGDVLGDLSENNLDSARFDRALVTRQTRRSKPHSRK